MQDWRAVDIYTDRKVTTQKMYFSAHICKGNSVGNEPSVETVDKSAIDQFFGAGFQEK